MCVIVNPSDREYKVAQKNLKAKDGFAICRCIAEDLAEEFGGRVVYSLHDIFDSMKPPALHAMTRFFIYDGFWTKGQYHINKINRNTSLVLALREDRKMKNSFIFIMPRGANIEWRIKWACRKRFRSLGTFRKALAETMGYPASDEERLREDLKTLQS